MVTTRSVLKTVTGRRLLTWSDLVTLLSETEAIVNCRPITYVNNELDSTFRILRPVDFLLFRPVSSLPPTDTEFPVRDLGEGGKHLASIWKARERYLDKLWSVWYDEYLLSLRERSNRFHKSGRMTVNRQPQVGEVVLLKEDGQPRGSWKLARIVKLNRSSDGHVRAAEIVLSNGVRLQRAINFLLPLEITEFVPPDQAVDSPNISGSSSRVDIADEPTDHRTQHRDEPTEPRSQPSQAEPFYGFAPVDIDHAANLLDVFDDELEQQEQH